MLTNASYQVTTFAYDSRNRLLSTTDPLGKVEAYAYDGNDNLLTKFTPKNETISFAYDAVGNGTSLTDSHGLQPFCYYRLICVKHTGLLDPKRLPLE